MVWPQNRYIPVSLGRSDIMFPLTLTLSRGLSITHNFHRGF